MRKIISLTLILWGANVWAAVPVHEDRNEAEYNMQYEVALDGYDPVSYFEEGGGEPQLGDPNIFFVYGTIEYHFSSQENLVQFKANPLKYEPTYGSWCAYGMARGGKIKVQPLIYTISGNRLHVFFNTIAKSNFDADVAGHEVSADENWLGFSGEQPRP